ncbi:MAG: hypothetical protein GY847_20630 [Proteobacteria bacterium]|nr:hypothetical protein [Pseudomonadota bacterium]
MSIAADRTPYDLLKKGESKPADIADPTTTRKDRNDEQKGSRLFCAICGHPITGKDQCIDINGSHEHTFANPGGHIYHIGCFRNALGCITMRDESTDFTWFSGYTWSVTGCSLCGAHMGWHFRSGSDTFFGLVLDTLVEKDEGEN